MDRAVEREISHNTITSCERSTHGGIAPDTTVCHAEVIRAPDPCAHPAEAEPEEVEEATAERRTALLATYTQQILARLLDCVDQDGYSALHHAVSSGHEALAAMLASKTRARQTFRGAQPLSALHRTVGGAIEATARSHERPRRRVAPLPW